MTERRTKVDFAHCMKELVDEQFPEAEVLRLVLDNLNTHSPASLYEGFEAAAARRITRKLEFHYTPKHGSWLNMAEVEIAVLSSQCLGRRIGDMERLQREVVAWEQARTKLKRLYPS